MKNEVNNEFYDTLGDRWYNAYDDPVALLRAESRVKYHWILERMQREAINPSEASVLDVGCGAGFFTNKIVNDGYNVSGVDLSPDSLEVAKRHDFTGKVVYQEADAYKLPFEDQSFDFVTNLDFLEHVEDPAAIVKEISRVLKPNGLFFCHTFNRNPISGFVVIKLVEWLVKNTPEHMHIYRLFVKPSEFEQYSNLADMTIEEWTGIRPCLMNMDVLRALPSGSVPQSFEFKLCKSTLISYMGMARKAHL